MRTSRVLVRISTEVATGETYDGWWHTSAAGVTHETEGEYILSWLFHRPG
jgi:hypothetical protein